MLAHLASLTAAMVVFLPDIISAQRVYTVWSSVVLTRAGEHTPLYIGDLTTELTSVGAEQLYNAGAFFRDRYATYEGQPTGLQYAPLVGLNFDYLDSLQTYATALDQQYCLASAQAFLQGFYPPYSPNGRNGSSASQDPEAISANGSYTDAPLHGYQYAHIHATAYTDYYRPFLGGNDYCPAWDESIIALSKGLDFRSTTNRSQTIYDTVGLDLLEGVLDPSAWGYENAYAIYDYLNYGYAHNETVKKTLDGLRDGVTNTSYIDMLRYLADRQQYTQLADMTAIDTIHNGSLGTTAKGSISTIAGNMLASKVLDQLESAIYFALNGDDFLKLNLFFADFQPFMSFFALAGLPNINDYFEGLPDFGSSLVFEVYSYSNTSSPSVFPDIEDLFVRVSFRNGTDDILQSYAMFGNGPDRTDLSWSEFYQGMSEIAMGSIGDWCLSCGAELLYCAAYNASLADTVGTSTATAAPRHSLSPAVGGIIGAVIALAVAGLLFALLMLFGGVRLHRVERRRKSDLGGFKGGQKMASDQDLTIPKGGAVVTKEEAVSPISPLGHERIGSWELKQQQQQQSEAEHVNAGQNEVHDAYQNRDHSFDDERVDPFHDPVKPREGV